MAQSLKMKVVEWDLRKPTSVVQYVFVIYRFLPNTVAGIRALAFNNVKAYRPLHEILEVSEPFRSPELCQDNGKVRLQLLQKIDLDIAKERRDVGLEEQSQDPHRAFLK